MKNNLILTAIASTLFSLSACNRQPNKWNLVWEENFNQVTGIDTTTWSKIPRTTNPPEWKKFMSNEDACYDMKDGQLILRGIKNPDRSKDTATYLTGGLYTKYKRAFHGGRLEIKAKVNGAKGAWPAIWLKPFEEYKYPWPFGGEIDIMERLNYDSIAYQTVHSNYTHRLGIKNNPLHGNAAKINPDDFNVYAVEMYKDSIVFFINDVKNFSYPRIETDKDGQFPFDKPYYLLIDMQLGGNWVGSIDPKDVPVEMQIDWVRYYQRNNKYSRINKE